MDIVRCEPDDPNRCQAVNKNGQCLNKAVPGTQYCAAHGGGVAQEALIKKSLRNYHLTRFQARLERFADAPELKSLRDEIAILRMMMEERLNQCEDAKDLLYQSGPISDLVLKIEKVVASCHKLELATGQLLDKQAVLNFGGELIAIISEEITDEEALGHISSRIMSLINRTFNNDSQID